jgi:biopolymer transport protein ExbB/TolQ
LTNTISKINGKKLQIKVYKGLYMLWITVIEWLARLILLILGFLSIWSLSIIIERKRFFKNLVYNKEKYSVLIKENAIFKTSSVQAESQDLIEKMLNSLRQLKTSEKIEKGFEVFVMEIRQELEKGLPVLGTLGSTSPFIGLLGTILGIIVSFGALSKGAADMNAVMLSLGEALILTAVGLVVAIPAVIAFNFYSRKARQVVLDLSSVKDLYIAYKD